MIKYGIIISTADTQFGELILKMDLASNMEKAGAFGYDGVELAIKDTSTLSVDSLRKLCSVNKLEIPIIGTGQINFDEGLSFANVSEEVRTKAVDRVNAVSRIAKEFDASIIIGLVRGTTKDDGGHGSKKNAIKKIRDCIQECLDYSSPWNNKFLIEPLHRYHTDIFNTLDSVREFIESFDRERDRERLGILIDTWHMNIEEFDVPSSMIRNKEYIKHVHLADSNRRAPGYGHFDFKTFLAILLELGYNGYASFEVFPWPDSDTCAVDALQFMKTLEKQITLQKKYPEN